MAYGSAIRQGLRIAGKIDRKYNLNKIFIEKYVPPGYRHRARQIVDIAGTLGGGYGIYNLYQSLNAPDTPGNYAEIPFKKYDAKTYPKNKTRGRYSRRSSRRSCYNRQPNRYR